jgi:hypothetical protein
MGLWGITYGLRDWVVACFDGPHPWFWRLSGLGIIVVVVWNWWKTPPNQQ